MLCRNCNNARIYRNVGFVCNETNQKPDFHVFCPYFRYYYSFRTKKEIQKKNNLLLDSYFRFTFGILIFFLISLKFFYLIVSILILLAGILSFSLIFKIFHKKEIKKYGYFFEVLSLASYYIINDKQNKSSEDYEILQQQFIKIYSIDIYNQNYINLEQFKVIKKIEKYQSKLKIDEKLSIFEIICEMYFFKNVDNNVSLIALINLANSLKINEKEYKSIIKLVSENEIKYHLQQKQKENYEKFVKNYNKKINYYEVLGLEKNATDSEIQMKFKELAKKYHPDKLNNDSENENIFKEITEAYYYIKKERNF